MSLEDKAHRGRIQAQGGGFEGSEPWSQEYPPSVEEGLGFLKKLADKIPKNEFFKRQSEFEKAGSFIEQAGENGGVSAKVSKTFKTKATKDVRVDIEVIKGLAFLKGKKGE